MDLTGVKNKATVKKEVSNFIINEILLSVSEEKSPVEGGKYKKGLSKGYAKFKGSSKANMELEGDMLDSLIGKNRAGHKIEIGIFNPDETGKADGHNHMHKDHKTLPKRQFIPEKSKPFKSHIMKGINQIISDNRVKKGKTRRNNPSIDELDQPIGFDLNDILGQDLLDNLLDGLV